MGWTTRNLTAQFGAPLGAGAPASYLLASDASRHVIYRQADANGTPTGHLTELYCGSDDVWHNKDITDEGGGPNATSDPSAYAFDAEGSQHVVFLGTEGDGHIHELYQSDGWHSNDLMSASSTVVTAANAPMGWASKFNSTQHVVFRGNDNRSIHLLSRGTGDGATWVQKTLTGGPTSAKAPGGFSFESAHTQHIYYEGDDQLFYEFVMDSSGWHLRGNLGVNVGASAAADPQPVGYGFGGDGSRHIPWRGSDGDIWEASSSGTQWSRLDLTEDRQARQPGSAPVGYAFESNAKIPVGTRHVIYTGNDSIVYEFWNDPSGWHVNPLTDGSFPSASSPSAFTDPTLATQNVFYISTTGQIIELRYTPGPVLGTIHHFPGGRRF